MSNTITFTGSTLNRSNVKAFSFYLLGEGASTTLTNDIIVSQISTPAVAYSGSVPLQDRYLNIWEWNGTDAYTYVGSSTNASHSGPDLVGVWSFEDLVLSPESKYIVLISNSPSNTFESTVQLRAAVYAKETQVEEQALWYDSISTNPPGSPSSEEYAVVLTITYTTEHTDTNAQLKIKVMTSAQLEQETVSATTFYVNADTKQLLLGEKLLVGKTYNPMIGTDGTSAGVEGLVPAPTTTDAGKYLKADGTWATVSTGDTLPSQTGQSGKFLTTNGTTISWAEVPAGGVAPTTKSFTGQTGATLATGLTLADYDTIMVFKNGMLLEEATADPVAANDYSISTNSIVFVDALVSTDIVILVCLGTVSSSHTGGSIESSVLTGYTGNTGSTLQLTTTGDVQTVYKNATELTKTTDYTVANNTITFTTALLSTDRITVETVGSISKITEISETDHSAFETAGILNPNVLYVVYEDA